MFRSALIFFALLAASSGHTQSADNGRVVVEKQCTTCHAVIDPEGNKLVGRDARTGPNLYGIVGRKAGDADFRYGSAILKAREFGLVWTEANLSQYLQDPSGFLAKFLDDPQAQSKMPYRVRNAGEAADAAHYLSRAAR
ncbi:cytochrome c [Poseidonocella pacifica]|uniref:Cytochrome c n=1 Tax=Poseidonocella pacifica TaxID=871651 RepID=A0A1I0XX93_9RHOB|nr:hypothetical protein [Poseidonocella pacifica]SFB04920.1 cytochrome c [Poseidonocella pacifica]